ncbi:MAG: chaperonin GroEL, partial [Chlamydiae bacterium]|nr:chaperonin GroEL [Chlamydiota bacterium]
IAILTGANFICEETGTYLKDAGLEDLGSAEKIILTKDKTTLVGGSGSTKNLEARISQIEAELKNTESTYDKEKLEERKAKLKGGVAVIRVGAPTEPEMKQKKQMFEDSLNSTRAALEEGILPGGGIALLQASKAANTLQISPEELVGAQIVTRACETPFKQIVSNAGFDSSVVLQQLQEKNGHYGFNAITEQVEDMIVAGVVDPVKVVKHALLFASSTAGIVLLSEALIGNAPEENEDKKK